MVHPFAKMIFSLRAFLYLRGDILKENNLEKGTYLMEIAIGIVGIVVTIISTIVTIISIRQTYNKDKDQKSNRPTKD